MTKKELLQNLFGNDFSNVKTGDELKEIFFAKKFDMSDLRRIHDYMSEQSEVIEGRQIPAVTLLNKGDEPYFILLALIHGNEPAGLASIAYAFALEQAGMLGKPVLCAIGNNLASKQFFDIYERESDKPQQTRDYYRRGVDEHGNPLPDMNRFPAGFEDLEPNTYHTNRLQELDYLADYGQGVIDIHSARGNMVCITDSSDNSYLKHSSIKAILTDLATSIGSATATVTYKTVAGRKDNIKHQFGIEAGTHEDPKAFANAAEWACSMLYSLDITKVEPLVMDSDEEFYEYDVQEKISFADLAKDINIPEGEVFVTVKDGKEYQYDEMEEILENQVVALSQPSGIELRAPYKFSGIFVTKSARVFQDEAIGLYPVSTDKMDTKFCYPCIVTKIDI